MRITPEWAIDVCGERNDNNRRVRQDRVDKYMKDIINGNWAVINNGIGFYKKGILADGQHRLWAVVEAQQAVNMLVTFGINPQDMPHIDEGAPRSTTDVANMMGIEGGTKHLGVSNYILEQLGVKRVTPKHEQIEFYGRHHEAIKFVCDRLNKKMIARSPVLAVCVRAYYSVDRAKLERFLSILQEGMIQEENDRAVLLLRNFLLSNNNNSGPFRAEMYQKTQTALKHFLDRNSVQRLHGSKEELFALPDDVLLVKA